VEAIAYSEPDHPVIGSFNHTRKLTSVCIARFGQVLAAMPEAVLQFRSHSFYDPAVRRWFLQAFLDAGIAPHQLQPLPYAPSGKDALKDYGRIHLHLDSYPVSGTTTTLDALAMGIPVLTCPNHLYAGAITAAILENAGLGSMVCERSDELPQRARQLCAQYRTAKARRKLAKAVRRSAVCDVTATADVFAEQIGLMLKAASLKQG
jgi:predicted O-linked N-acetylglucosamine transferase (SPINDLY family)